MRLCVMRDGAHGLCLLPLILSIIVVTMMWSVCNDCNNAVVSCPIVMIVAIVVSLVDSDNMVQK